MKWSGAMLAFAFGMSTAQPTLAQGSADAEANAALAEFVAALSPEASKSTRLCVVFDVTSQLVGADTKPQRRHHVLSFSPDLQQYRYDHIDFRFPGPGPHVSSTFHRGKETARWSGAVTTELLPEILRGTGAVQPRSGICYQGVNAESSPDIVLHVLGRTITGAPIVDWVKALGPAHANLTRPSATHPYFSLLNDRFVLEVEPNGVLKYLALYYQPTEGAAPEIFEELRVLSMAQFGPVTLPAIITRRQTVQEGLLEERYELRLESSREITQAELNAASDPVLPVGVEMVDSTGIHATLKQPRRVFDQDAGR